MRGNVMSSYGPSPERVKFDSQTLELEKVLRYRERVEDFLSTDSAASRALYDEAASLMQIEITDENIRKREAILNKLNMHIMQVCFDDADNDTLQIQYISRLSAEFFQLPENQEKFQKFRELHINGQDLRVLPESVVNVKNIMVLNLSANNFQSLPDILPNFPQLKLLNLQQNPLSDDAFSTLTAQCLSKQVTLQGAALQKNVFRYK